MKGSLDQFSFSGCCDINPLQNDVGRNVIKEGIKMLFNGRSGVVLGEGIRSFDLKHNLILTGDMLKMKSDYIGGYKTGAGPEFYDSVAIPIPILNEQIFKDVQILNEDIPLVMADIHGRRLPITEKIMIKFGTDKMKDLFLKVKILKRKTMKTFNNYVQLMLSMIMELFDGNKCFGCELCVYLSNNTSYQMKLDSINAEINDNEYNIPITFRQSDIKRGK